ncbi:PD40 domain-containing protein [Streptomyces sp. G44]|uniref:RICIN domain-containing protein n=1 Tax=Streptomyces sp. G44 TaxID=2807632 RepID=UPI001960966D|nr:RICIN domain-containing protein [Streptomyces sp. G44]MBM7171212.1 PD40 domain-containing protein [Streptomyces sp. G44]
MKRQLGRSSHRMRSLVVPLAAAVAVASVGLSAPRAHAASAVNIIAVHSGKCVETEGSSLSLDAPIVQADCTGQAGAEWYLRESPTGGDTVNVVNARSGHCLTVPDPGSARVGTETRQGACTAAAGADFRVVDTGAEHVGLRAAAPSPALCLDVASGSHTSGVPVQLAQCYGQSGSGFVQRAPREGNATALDTPPALPPATVAERVNLASGGAQTSTQLTDSAPVLSADGRYAAFTSDAATLVPGDKNLAPDVFVRDRSTGTTERVSLTDGDTESAPAEWSDEPSISGDGRYVAFESVARALVSGDTNGHRDVFVRDRTTGTTQRVSVAGNGTQGNNWSFDPSISTDGRYVAFRSGASNLVPGDTNAADDIFVHDRQARTTQRVSVAGGGAQGNGESRTPSISADGRYVAYTSAASNLVPGDTNAAEDVFVRDLTSGTTQRVSVTGTGGQGGRESSSPSISADGRHVAFSSSAPDLVPGDTNGRIDAYVRDRQAGTTQRVSVADNGTQGDGHSGSVSISGDGRRVAFSSSAGNLIARDANAVSDIFVHDQETGKTQRISTDHTDGGDGDHYSSEASISADGRFTVFSSAASDLVPDDSNATYDVFVRRTIA